MPRGSCREAVLPDTAQKQKFYGVLVTSPVPITIIHMAQND